MHQLTRKSLTRCRPSPVLQAQRQAGPQPPPSLLEAQQQEGRPPASQQPPPSLLHAHPSTPGMHRVCSLQAWDDSQQEIDASSMDSDPHDPIFATGGADSWGGDGRGGRAAGMPWGYWGGPWARKLLAHPRSAAGQFVR